MNLRWWDTPRSPSDILAGLPNSAKSEQWQWHTLLQYKLRILTQIACLTMYAHTFWTYRSLSKTVSNVLISKKVCIHLSVASKLISDAKQYLLIRSELVDMQIKGGNERKAPYMDCFTTNKPTPSNMHTAIPLIDANGLVIDRNPSHSQLFTHSQLLLHHITYACKKHNKVKWAMSDERWEMKARQNENVFFSVFCRQIHLV